MICMFSGVFRSSTRFLAGALYMLESFRASTRRTKLISRNDTKNGVLLPARTESPLFVSVQHQGHRIPAPHSRATASQTGSSTSVSRTDQGLYMPETPARLQLAPDIADRVVKPTWEPSRVPPLLPRILSSRCLALACYTNDK